ncbi:MAG TPA: hypothetical protein VMR76_02050 [Candidatus Saccharimonadia bacterium]|nr:hypothetical protein [Candidatus Saccharimonadia bacterium]
MKIFNKKFDSRGFSHVELILMLLFVGLVFGVGYYVWNRNHPINSSHAGSYTLLGKGYMCNPTPAASNCSSTNYQAIYDGYVCKHTTKNSKGTYYWIKGYAVIVSGSQPDFPIQTGAQIELFQGSGETSKGYLTILPMPPILTNHKTNLIHLLYQLVLYQPVHPEKGKHKVPESSIYIRFILQSLTANFTPSQLPSPLNKNLDQYIKLLPC